MRWAVILSSCALLAGCVQSSADTPKFDTTNFWIPGLVGVTGEGATGFGPAGYPNVQDDSIDFEPVQQFLASVGLQPSDIAAGEQLLLAPKGNLISQPTMQLCAAEFDSEFARLVRRKIEIADEANDPVGLFTEAVQYESAEAATQALSELTQVATECRTAGGFEENGKLIEFDFFNLGIDENVDVTLSENFVELQWSIDGIRSSQIWQQRGNTLVLVQSDGPIADSRLFAIALQINERLKAANPLDIGELD